MPIELLLVGAALTWRLSSLLVHERGPFDVFGRLRDWVGITYDEQSQAIATTELAQVFECVWCCSIWVGWGVAFFTFREGWVIAGLVYSAGAVMMERWAHG